MRLAWTTLVIILGSVFSAGCSSPFSELRSELRESGWELWYPAEAGVEPGQIWVFSDGRRDLLARRPEELSLAPSHRVQFRSLQASIDLTAAVAGGTSFGDLSHPSASGRLLAKHARHVELDFGQTFVQRIVIDDLATQAKSFPATYRSYLANAPDGGNRRVLTSVVQCVGLRYRVVADKSFDAEAAAKALREDLQIGVTVTQVSSNTYEFSTPQDIPLVIGVGELAVASFPTTTEGKSALGGSSARKPILLCTVDVQSRRELRPSLVQQNDSDWVHVSIPPGASRLRFRVRDAGGLTPQFDVSETGIGNRYYGRGLHSGDIIEIDDQTNERLDFQIANVCDGPDRPIKIDVYAE